MEPDQVDPGPSQDLHYSIYRSRRLKDTFLGDIHPEEPGRSAVLEAGSLLGAAELGLLASLGIPGVKVKRKLKVAFFSTGDELRPVGEALAEGQIYDSNRYTIYGMLKGLGVEIIDLGVIPDDPQAVEQAFREAADLADAIITSGGVSVGDADYVKDTLQKLGQVNFWKIAMKPGKPLAFGKVEQAVFFGLPGNPVSVMATFYQFALPALRRLMGHANLQTIQRYLDLLDSDLQRAHAIASPADQLRNLNKRR